jgi:hypothetical protein
MNIDNPIPGQVLYRKVRVAFINNGTTLGAWCKARDVNPAAARAALLGSWNGKGGEDLRRKILKASGIAPHQHRAA